MCASVVHKVTLQRKSGPAHIALAGLLARVKTSMLPEMASPGKAPVTLLALVRSLASVDPFMVAKLAFVCKSRFT